MLRHVSSSLANAEPSPPVTPAPSPSASNVVSPSRTPDSRLEALTRQRSASSSESGASTSRVRQATLPRVGAGARASGAPSSNRPEGGTPTNEPYENPFVLQRPWLRQAMAEMSTEGAQIRRWRPFQKSASRQYLYAKSLTRPQRDELAQALEHEFRHAPQPDTRLTAAGMWLSVQQARLRTHDPAHRQDHDGRQAHNIAQSIPFVLTIPIAIATTRDRRRRYYNTPLRPEYPAAFDSFMRVIGDQSVDEDVRNVAAERLEYHWRSEGTIAPNQQHELREHGVRELAASGYRASTDPARVELTAGERAFVLRMGRQATTPDIWAAAVRSELEHVRRSVAYLPDRRSLPAVEAQIRTLERDLGVAERAAEQARGEARVPMPAPGIRRPSVMAMARSRLSSRPDLATSTPVALAQALEEELSDLLEQDRPDHLRLSEHDYQVLVETAMTEVSETGRASRPPRREGRRHSPAAVRDALNRWQQIRQAEREQPGALPEGEAT